MHSDRALPAASEVSTLEVNRGLRYLILVTDLIILIAATFIGFVTRFSVAELNTSLTGEIQLVGTLIPPLWIVMLVLVGAYDTRVLGLGLSEYGRLIKSALWMVAIVSLVSFLGKFDTSRAYVLIAIPLGLLGLLIERWLWRRWILHQRNRGKELQPTIVVGDPDERGRIADALDDRPWAGYRVVGTMRGPVTDQPTDVDLWIDELLRVVDEKRASCIALTSSTNIGSADVRELSWRIEGRGIDLLISSSYGAITGPRLSLRVATGLPFMHLDEVGLSATERGLKRLLDVVGAGVLVVVLSPVLLLIALLILITSGRPVLFIQQRAGFQGEFFNVLKFRTMVPDADDRRDELRSVQVDQAPTLKLKADPRVTPLGRFLRRWSLDELPQLFNVLGGSMSLVGPRPHPIDDVERYREGDTRRLLAKPGMTGMWQVAGRSDLSWKDAVELDLIYIENWSLLGDLTILARTLQAVVSRRGAY